MTIEQRKFHARNPFRITSGEGKGQFPHEVYDLDQFTGWLIEQMMTDSDYFTNLASGDTFARKLDAHGKPVATRSLSADQRGWAKHDYPNLYTQQGIKWFVLDPDKPRALLPAYFDIKRSRKIALDCECETPDYAEWGVAYDKHDLWQCENCGEVVIVIDEDEEYDEEVAA